MPGLEVPARSPYNRMPQLLFPLVMPTYSTDPFTFYEDVS